MAKKSAKKKEAKKKPSEKKSEVTNLKLKYGFDWQKHLPEHKFNKK